jgi:AcrR family transcriptional regulator
MVAPDHASIGLLGDDDSSKRRQILDGAGKVFMDLGFDGASMGEIARAAGVSKGTLYVYFADKSRLFEAIVEQESLAQGEIAFSFDPARDVATTLREFGEAYINLICRPGGGSAIRTVMAIAERMPDVGRRYYECVLDTTINRLAAYLDAHVASGELVVEDRQLAASQFMMMCQASLFLPFIFQAAPAPSPERISQVVDSAIRMFLAAYRAGAT